MFTHIVNQQLINGYMASDIWLRTILIVRKETRCRHEGYSFRLAARVLLYAPSHRRDSTYHSLCYTSRGALAGTRKSSMGSPHEGLIRRPIAPWANALTTELHLAPGLPDENTGVLITGKKDVLFNDTLYTFYLVIWQCLRLTFFFLVAIRAGVNSTFTCPDLFSLAQIFSTNILPRFTCH